MVLFSSYDEPIAPCKAMMRPGAKSVRLAVFFNSRWPVSSVLQLRQLIQQLLQILVSDLVRQ